MTWKDTLYSLNYEQVTGRRFALRQDLRPPANLEMILDVENKLRTRFPLSLRSLLLETNGVMERMSVEDGEWFDESWTIWPLELISEQNSWHRKSYAERNLERFVFFTTAGADGISFGFSSASELVDDAEVYAWYPDETDDKRVANGLAEFLRGWCSGLITV